ncbi:MAG: hypothetical protein R1F54_11270 [Candidatus Zeuxoniibacter abyssi]|nr:MAG: hypothetical protein R1F54_11270 [Candidatus Persebacteraceae bacterium AB1(2)]
MEKIKEMKEQWEKDNHFVAYRTLQRIVVEHLYLRKVKEKRGNNCQYYWISQ